MGQLLQPGQSESSPMRVSGHAVSKSTTWRFTGTTLVNKATEAELGLSPKLVHSFSIEEMRDLERHSQRSERELSAKVCKPPCDTPILSQPTQASMLKRRNFKICPQKDDVCH
jgi:hypothetical protein